MVALKTKKLQSLNGVKIVRDLEKQWRCIRLGSCLYSFAGDDWPVERVSDASEAVRIEGRNFVGVGDTCTDTFKGEFGENFLSSNQVSILIVSKVVKIQLELHGCDNKAYHMGMHRNTEDILFAHLRRIESPLRCCPPWDDSMLGLGEGGEVETSLR